MGTLPVHLQKGMGGGDNVLLRCPRFEPAEKGACIDLLTLGDVTGGRILCISFTQSPEDYRAAWDRHAETAPERVTIIDVRGTVRSREEPTDSSADSSGNGAFDPAVERVDSPGDLTTLGVRITACLNALEAAHGHRRTRVCFDSVSTLLQYADTARAFAFLDTLTAHFTGVDAVAHYHMDPNAHDEETVQRLAGVFDAVCEYDDGEWTFRQG